MISKSIIVEIEKIFNTKITNKLSAYLSEINSTFIVKLSRINNELNNKLNEEVNVGFSRINIKLNAKLIAEIKKINSHDARYASKTQKILLMVNNMITKLDNIEEVCHNDFGNILSEFTSIKTFIEALRSKMIQYYAIV